MNHVHKFCLPLLLTLSAIPAPCQDYEELKIYQDASGQMSTLFRGVDNTRYNIRFNGTYYWESDVFRKGEIFFDGKLYRDVYLNIDACSQTAVVSYNLSTGLIALDTRKVLYVQFGDRRFENLNLMGHEEMPSGFYERICHRNVNAYRRVDKVLRSSYESANGAQFIGYTDPHYRSGVLDYFYYQPTYYLMKDDGSMLEIRNVNVLLKQFPDCKSEIKRYCAARRNLSGRAAENRILAAFEYLEK